MMKIVVVFMILVGVAASQFPGEDGTSVCVDPAKPICNTTAAANAGCIVLEEIARLIARHYTAPVYLPRDCSDPLLGKVDSGVYMIQPLDQGSPILVYCDMETDGGGWTVFQRRQDGSVEFYLGWENYRRGFGDLNGEFWLGNDNLHHITSKGEYELRVDMTDHDNNSSYAAYNTFRIGCRSDRYRLTVEDYSGPAGDSLTYHNQLQFSTWDHAGPHDCAKTYHGAWWYRNCHKSNLNGEYLEGATDKFARGVVWFTSYGYYYSLKTTEMKMKRKL